MKFVMKFLLDMANLEETKKAINMGLRGGVTTNPSSTARKNGTLKETPLDACDLVDKSTRAEVVNTDLHGIMENPQTQALLATEPGATSIEPCVSNQDNISNTAVNLDGGRESSEKDWPRFPLRLFCSYSSKDDKLRCELETHLKLLERTGLIKLWDSPQISGGSDWEGQIDENLEQADIILLLVSSDFIASDYCYDVEMTRALERHSADQARVIPIIVRDVYWKPAPFAKFQALPTNGEAVTTWPSTDSAWRNVVEGVAKVVDEFHRSRSGGGLATIQSSQASHDDCCTAHPFPKK